MIPRTSVLGAILLTGYLGGATATHVRIGEPFFAPIFSVCWSGEGCSCAMPGCAHCFPCGTSCAAKKDPMSCRFCSASFD